METGRKSINLLSEEFGISRLKVRKILITTGDVVYPTTRSIQDNGATTMQELLTAVCDYYGDPVDDREPEPCLG